LGYFFPGLNLGFFASTLSTSDSLRIFYYEALCVFCALQDILARVPAFARVVIYTDNLNTVQIFNSLACLPTYNHILRRSVDTLLSTNISLRILHIPGEVNVVADALSRHQFERARIAAPGLVINTFKPPLWSLGAVEK
ncbi:hypothetical protein M413DRAFT_40015, partial [Hebeloma cylindrosporum]